MVAKTNIYKKPENASRFLNKEEKKSCPKGWSEKNVPFFENNISAFLKHFFYSLNLLGVKEKVLGM